MQYSNQQLAIFEQVKNRVNTLISAGPGSGKSTTLVELVKQLPGNVLIVVFNNSTANELMGRIPDNATVITCHKLGYALVNGYAQAHGIKREFNKFLHGDYGDIDAKLNQLMFWDILAEQKKANPKTANSVANMLMSQLKDACVKLKVTLTDYNDVNAVVNTLIKYNLPIDNLDLIVTAMQKSNDAFLKKQFVDFGDMLYLPHKFDMQVNQYTKLYKKSVPKYDFCLTDEGQDISNAMADVISRYISPETTMVIVGDAHQCINSFAGSDIDSLDQLKKRFNLTELPLTISYRCPQTHINQLNDIFGTDLICGNDRTGTIQNITTEDIIDNIQLGDIILSRTNAALLPVMQMLIKEGMPCRLLGLDIMAIINKNLKKDFEKDDIIDASFVWKVIELAEDKKQKLLDKKWGISVATKVADELLLVANLLEFYNENYTNVTWADFCDFVTELESNKDSCISLMSAHKSKGLQSNGIYLLDASSFPVIRENCQEWEKLSEIYLHYVALSRAKENLFLVN